MVQFIGSGGFIDYYNQACENGCDPITQIIASYDWLSQGSGPGTLTGISNDGYFGLNDVFPVRYLE